jgi:hypothetical protein
VSDERSGRPIRVIDRRWFTSDGELREPIPDAAPGRTAEVPQQRDSAAAAPEVPEPETEPEEHAEAAGGGEVLLPSGVGFLDLVDALLRPAYALLSGQIPGGSPDTEGARFYIDLLEVLRTKTRGRLSPQEAKVLDDALHQMRSLYLAATR